MVAKLICHGEDRNSAIATSNKALSATTLEGITHNIDFLINTINHQEFIDMKLFTGFVDKHKAELLSSREAEVTA